MNLDKITEKILSEMIISDTKSNIDQSQYGNQPKTSIQHYLINMLHEILSNLDKNRQGNKIAVILAMIDWKEAFPRQCPKLGVQAFMDLGVRPQILPILVNFFQNRSMQVKWNGVLSAIKKLKGSGPMGSTIGLLEYLFQSNDNSDDLNCDEKFKFIDDMSTLEVVNLLTIGIASFNFNSQVPNDIATGDMYIPAENLRTQNIIDNLSNWTDKKKMVLNQNKSKLMIFNNTRDMKFHTRIKMKNVDLEIVNQAKLLGTVLTSDLKWDANTSDLIKRARPRLLLLSKASEYTSNYGDLKMIYITFVRSVLEQSAAVWHSSLTQENMNDLERVQKNAMRIILKENYSSYFEALQTLKLDDLYTRREDICKQFAFNALNNPKMKKHFNKNNKLHAMNVRKSEEYNVKFAYSERLKKSAIPYFQRILNANDGNS